MKRGLVKPSIRVHINFSCLRGLLYSKHISDVSMLDRSPIIRAVARQHARLLLTFVKLKAKPDL